MTSLGSAWLVAPVLLPLAAALALVPMGDRVRLTRAVSVLSVLAQLAIAAAVMHTASTGAVLVHRFGDWPIPYGIVFVGDRLAALMLVVTAVLALGSVTHAIRGEDRDGAYFHTLFQLQLAGLNGAFLTGDLFTLFVFFEVLLIASYCLLVHGATGERVRWGVHYVVLNLVGSALFLAAAGVIYGMLGTLNLAEIARRVAALPAGDVVPVQVAALMLLLVFALKAAVAPVHLWLPGTYSAASASVAALFAIMTKVGVYAILRVFGVAFGAGAGQLAGTAAPWLFPAGIATALLGAVAAVGVVPDTPTRVRRQMASLLVASVGALVASIAALEPTAVGAGLFYLVHSTIAAGAMFLVCAVAARSRSAGVGILFTVAALALVGLPPLSGFVGKALMLAAAPAGDSRAWLWTGILGSSFLALFALLRSGDALFWWRRAGGAPVTPATPLLLRDLAPATALLVVLGALTVLAGPVSSYTLAASRQLLEPMDMPGSYVSQVLTAPGGR